MNIKDHVPSLETCKRLKELGWEKGTVFYWQRVFQDDWAIGYCHDWDEVSLIDGKYLKVNNSGTYCEMILDGSEDVLPAPLASELGEELPEAENAVLYMMRPNSNWCIRYTPFKGKSVPNFEVGGTMAEATAKMWIYLKENKLI